MKLPNCKKPCSNCPFRKDTLKGWLGEERIKEILNSKSFTCHKTTGTKEVLQCAGHMIIKGESNEFYRTAKLLKMDFHLKGKDLIFSKETDLIKHHS